MNIEDLIREANPVRTRDLAASDSPHAQRALVQILQGHTAATAAGRRRHSRRGRKRTLTTVGLAATVAGATAAAVVLAVPGGSQRPAPGAAHDSGAHAKNAQLTTARQVLLTAAAHVASTPTTGRYWRVQEISGINVPGGTKAHPYDISLANSYDQWNPRSAGQKEWDIARQLGARPATPADAAAWRVAGSPSAWHSGQHSTWHHFLVAHGPYPFHWALDVTTDASAQAAGWQVGDGTVGYVEGDLPGLKAAQFRQMPTSPAAVAAVLRHYYANLHFCIQQPSSCSTEDQIVWSEAVALLGDPVSAQVRSATFRVMASLRGVRLLGPMTDPLGRRGYGLAIGPDRVADGGWKPVQAVVIDPRTGSLLATEDIGPIPRSLRCAAGIPAEGAVRRGTPVFRLRIPLGKATIATCAGPSFEGRSYQGQVDDYVALVSAGWTNASPVLPPPSTWQAHTGFPGLPPEQAPFGDPGPPTP
jgi:hypothetical protein